MIDNFTAGYDFIEQPDNDGQPLHVTEGDPGGATVYGWTEATWMAAARLLGISPATPEIFAKQTKQSLMAPTRAMFWNQIQGDHMPPGFDVFWFDFQFGSFGATKVLQAELGVSADGHVGPITLGTIAAANPRALLNRFLVARTLYYDHNGFRSRWPGLYRRAAKCHDLAISLI